MSTPSAVDPQSDSLTSSLAWAEDIIRTAHELGYAVMSMSPSIVRVVPERGGKTLPTIELEGYYLTGKSLRRVLAPVVPE